MPHTTTWVIEKRVIHFSLIGELDVEASTEAAKSVGEAIKQGDAAVHLIVDVSKQDKGLTNIRNVSGITEHLKDPKLGWIIVVGANTMVKFISSIVGQMSKFKLSTANTVDDAVAFLKKQDSTLNTEPVVQ